MTVSLPVTKRVSVLPITAVIVAVIAAMPILAIFWLALTGSTEGWQHLLANVLPRAGFRTFLLLAMTAATTAFFRHRLRLACHHIRISIAADIFRCPRAAARHSLLSGRLCLR